MTDILSRRLIRHGVKNYFVQVGERAALDISFQGQLFLVLALSMLAMRYRARGGWNKGYYSKPAPLMCQKQTHKYVR